MRHSLTYDSAVRLLGGDTKAIRLLDTLSAATTVLVGGIDLLEARAEIIRIGKDVIKSIDARIQGLNRADRTHLLEASHSVIVIAAFFEALDGLDLPIDIKKLKLTGREQVAILATKSVSGNKMADLVAALLSAEVPLPDEAIPFTQLLGELEKFYYERGQAFCDFMEGLDAFDRLTQTKKDRFYRTVRGGIAQAAVNNYKSLYRRLAIECEEFYVWGRLNADAATQALVKEGGDRVARKLETLSNMFAAHEPALASLGRFLDLVSTQQNTSELREMLSVEYGDLLDQSIVETGYVPSGLVVPSLREAYIAPPFRVREVLDMTDDPSQETWWKSTPKRNDLAAYLAGYLTSSRATTGPLLILGQPGSGKSVLVKILSALLPPEDFFPVRVVLRDVGTEMGLIEQIESAVSGAVNRQVDWSAISEAAAQSIPVVLLDGFDELLQATGVSQSDYLIKVQDFQRKQSLRGRPTAVVVTTRTAVANRARFPKGTTALHLESFDDLQVAAWLEIWNRMNQSYFDSNGVHGLDLKTALANKTLAEQPLLLLMLALYDLSGNQLSAADTSLGKTDLYEGLLAQFARREVEKTLRGASDKIIAARVEDELIKLSVIAFAMFNRGAQWVSDSELDRDMIALKVGRVARAETEMRVALTPAELVVGRFFFVYEARATQDGNTIQTYEFLHATFAEFLVARLVKQLLLEMAKHELDAESSFAPPLDDGRVHALLSFAPLTTRAAVVGFLAELFDQVSPAKKKILTTYLKRLLVTAQYPRTDSSYADYRPRLMSISGRIAAYTANLVALLTVISGEFNIVDFWNSGESTREVWQRLATLWRAELREDEWINLVKAVTVTRGSMNGTATVSLKIANEQPDRPKINPSWLGDLKESGGEILPDVLGPVVLFDDVLRDSYFSCGIEDNVIVHTLEPFALAIGRGLTTFGTMKSGEMASGGHILLQAWCSGHEGGRDERADLYRECMAVGKSSQRWGDKESKIYWSLLLKVMNADPETPRDLLREAVLIAARLGARNHEILNCALRCVRNEQDEILQLISGEIDRLGRNPEDNIVALSVWVRLVEMGADGSVMVKVKRFVNPVPLLNNDLSLEMIASSDQGLVRRARWAMEHMNLADRVHWPEGC